MIIRRIRGLLSIAVTWGITISAVSTTLLVVATGLLSGSVFGPRQIVIVAVRNFIAGAVAGMIFSLLFARGARQQTLETLSLRRVALWGFLGVAIPTTAIAVAGRILYSLPLMLAPVGVALAGAMGSAMSLATVKLARRAPALPEHTEI